MVGGDKDDDDEEHGMKIVGKEWDEDVQKMR